jgi:AcrR family transcriptional regulator
MDDRDLAKRPSRGPGRLSAEEAEQLNDRLLDAAAKLFSEAGYAATTMDKIAREAGASTKTLYSRYANKADILQATVRRFVERTLAAHLARVSIDPSAAEPHAFLTGLGRQVATVITEQAGLNRMALSEGYRDPELVRLFKAVPTRTTALLAGMLRHWQGQGLLPLLDDPDKAAFLCLQMVAHEPRIRTALGDPMTPSEIEDHVSYAVEVFLRGQGYPGAGGGKA